MNPQRHRFRQVAAFTLGLFALAANGIANAEISLSPLRQVISENRDEAIYEISNPSGRILDVKVGWVDLAAAQTGYERATPDHRAQMSAAPYLTVSPAHLRLEPGARGEIKVALKKGVTPPPGERRSHLLVETSAARTPLRKAGGGLQADVGLGLSTPVLLRGGRGKSAAVFSKTRLVRDKEGQLELETTLDQTGPFSVYGRIEAVMAPTNSSKRLTVAELSNVTVYTDHPSRTYNIPLNMEFLPAGILTLRYIGEAEYKGREFAAKSFEIEAPK